MSGRNRSQTAILSILSSNIQMLPIGDYKVHIDSVRIEKGSVKLTARILETIRKEEEDANER